MFDDVSLSTMLATFVIFLAMIVILNALLYKPLLKFMDDRAESIKKDENRVQQNSEEMLNFGDELEKIKQATREEIASIKQKALDEARLQSSQSLEVKKAELEEQMSVFKTKLEKEKIEFRAKLLEQIPVWQDALKTNLKKA